MYSERERERIFSTLRRLSRCSRAEREEVLVARKLRPKPRAPRPAQGRRLACASCSPGPLTGFAPRSVTHVQFDPTHLLDADPLFVASRCSLLIRRRVSIKALFGIAQPVLRPLSSLSFRPCSSGRLPRRTNISLSLGPHIHPPFRPPRSTLHRKRAGAPSPRERSSSRRLLSSRATRPPTFAHLSVVVGE